MPAHPGELAVLALLWLAYFAVHSGAASLRVKRRVAARYPGAMPYYRAGFNTLAVLLLAPPLAVMLHYDGPWLVRWEGWSAWLANGIGAAALLGFFVSTRYYDTGEFLGVRQIRARETAVEDQEHLQLSPLHCYVRHPWYFFALLILWTRDMNAAHLVSVVLATGYFIYGSRLEEKKLMIYHGPVYRQYMTRVPGLIPRPWRFLDRAAAAELLRGLRDGES